MWDKYSPLPSHLLPFFPMPIKLFIAVDAIKQVECLYSESIWIEYIRTQSSGEKDLMTEGNTLPRAWGLLCFLWRIQRVNQLYLETVSRKETADASQSTCDLAMLLICLDDDDQIPSSSCLGWLHSLITSYPLSQRCFLLPSPKVESMANSSETATMVPTIRIVGEYNSVSSVQSISRLNCI